MIIRLVLSVLSALVLSGAVAKSFAQPSDGLSLAVDIEKSEIAVGEPVYVIATLRNESGRTTDGVFDVAPESTRIKVEIIRDGGLVGPFLPLAVTDVDRPKRSLAPGETTGGAFGVFYGARSWTFVSPGSYRIRATYADSRDADPLVATSDPFAVYEDALGRALVDDESGEAGRYMAWLGGDHLKAGLSLLKRAARSETDSTVADHARWILGESLSRPFHNYLENRARPPRPEEALAYLNAVKLKNFGPFARMMVHMARARSYHFLRQDNDKKNAYEMAGKIVSAYPALENQYEALIRDIDEPYQPDLNDPSDPESRD